MGKLILAILAVAIGLAVYWSRRCCHPPTPPHLDDEWWGPEGVNGRTDDSVRPFSIKFGDEMIRDLKDRLKRHRTFQPPLENVGFRYGFNSEQLDSWITYWAEKYNFTEREKWLNQYPQFKTNVQGLDIHFIRVKPQVASNIQVVPLLLLHGWPGSVREFYEAIPLLTKQRPGYDFAFEVIVPNLPGYGFSDPAVRPGLGVAQIAVIMKNLMNRLGFKQYYVHGGDWGALIVSSMSTLYPDEVLGHHTNMATVITRNTFTMMETLVGSFWPSLVVEPHLADRMYPLADRFSFLMEEFGYFHLQATKPDTVGVALTDSPAGLLAYILEKFSTWTILDFRNLPDGGLYSGKFTKHQLIDNLMFYWASNSITTSMRLYAETMSSKHRALKLEDVPTTVPTWVIQAKYETYSPPKHLKRKYVNLVNVTVLNEGGHLLALEMPGALTEDVFRAVKAFRHWHVENKDRYKKNEL